MCARACMYACVCVHVYAGSHKDRKMIWFINYVMNAHTHTQTFVCVCVFGCSHIRRRKEFHLSKALTLKKIERFIDSR